MANTKIFIFDEDIKYLQRDKNNEDRKKLEVNIESLGKLSRIQYQRFDEYIKYL